MKHYTVHSMFKASPLSPRHGAFSWCGWRRRPPDMEDGCEYSEHAVAVSR